MLTAAPPLPPVKGSFSPLDGGTPLILPFNPSSFRLQRSVNWTSQSATSQAYTTLQFASGETDTLSMQLLLDASESTLTILPTVQTIYGWTLPLLIAPGTTRPPCLLFQWGVFQFQGVVQSVGFDFLLFDLQGNPKRATVSLEMLGHAFSRGTPPAQFFGQAPVTTASGVGGL